MRRQFVAICVITGMGVGFSAVAENWADRTDRLASAPEFAQSKQVCRDLKSVVPPSADAPDAVAAKSLAGCRSEALYYGIGVPRDPKRAQQCAFVEMKNGDNGGAILMTIYANGVGTDRDLGVATALACQLDGSLAEMDFRVLHLWKLKQGGAAERDFSWCDDITSGSADAACAAHESRIADTVRDGKLRMLAARWTGTERRAFTRLQDATAAFITARSENEVDQSGTSGGAYVIEEQDRLKDEFIDDLSLFVSGNPPSYDAKRFREADTELNATYRDILRAKAWVGAYGTVTQAGIQTTQRFWLKCRDAWVAFAEQAYPQVSSDNVRAWLTIRRIKELEEFPP
jgi:hypothetical protein